MSTTLYPKLSQPAPSGIFLPITQPGILSGTAFYLLDTTAPSGPQQGLDQPYTNMSNNSQGTSLGFCSRPLGAGVISAGGWSAGTAIANRNASHVGGRSPGNFSPVLYVYLINGTNGVSRGQLASFGSPFLLSGNFPEETTGTTGGAGSALTAVAGDYLLFLFALYDASSGSGNIGSVSGIATWYTDGTTAITGSGAGTSDAQSFLTAPVTLSLAAASSIWCVAGARVTMDGAAIPPHFNGPFWS